MGDESPLLESRLHQAGDLRIAAGTREGVALLWPDRSVRDPIRLHHGGPGPILGLAWSGWDGGPLLWIGAGDRIVRGFDLVGNLVRTLAAPRPIGSLAAGRSTLWGLSIDRRVVYAWTLLDENPRSWTAGRPIADLTPRRAGP